MRIIKLSSWENDVAPYFSVKCLGTASSAKKFPNNASTLPKRTSTSPWCLPTSQLQASYFQFLDIVDTYRNLTLKHQSAYEWTLERCPDVGFVLKVDDDTYVDTIHLPTYLAANKLGQSTEVLKISKLPGAPREKSYCQKVLLTLDLS